jgi:hypothetical protein
MARCPTPLEAPGDEMDATETSLRYGDRRGGDAQPCWRSE